MPGGGEPRPWEMTLFKAAVIPAGAAAAVCLVVGQVLRGRAGLLGAAVGALLTIFALGLTLYVARRTRTLHPVLTMSAALMSYLFTMTVLLLALVVVFRTPVIDRQAAGLSMLTVVLVWLPAQVLAFSRLKILYVDMALSDSSPLTPSQERPNAADSVGDR